MSNREPVLTQVKRSVFSGEPKQAFLVSVSKTCKLLQEFEVGGIVYPLGRYLRIPSDADQRSEMMAIAIPN